MLITLLTEAVNAILAYSHTASQLLKRKKVKREHIYQFLAEKGIIESVTSDKPTLIKRALLYWGSHEEVSCWLFFNYYYYFCTVDSNLYFNLLTINL